MRRDAISLYLTIFFGYIVVVPCSGSLAAEYEVPAEVSVAHVLPVDKRLGDHFTVNDPVLHDGLVYVFDVETPFGAFTAESEEGLDVIINEINAIAVLSEVEKTDEFGKAAAAAGKGVGTGLKRLFTKPGETMKEAGSGVGRMFKRTGERLRSEPSEFEDNAFKSFLGVSQVKRQYAQHLGVDPYSQNEVLQDKLDEVAWAAFSGGLGISVLTAFIPGPVGVVVGFSGATSTLQQQIFTQSPTDLRMNNRELLLGMGVEKSLANAFIDNGNFSPTDQTFLVGSLATVSEAKNRQAFVAYATGTPDPQVAYVRRRMAEMFASYNQSNRIQEFRSVGSITAGIDSDDAAVICVPLDRFLWTEDLASTVKEVTEELDTWEDVDGRVLVLTGTVSDLAHQEFTAQGWSVQENVRQ